MMQNFPTFRMNFWFHIFCQIFARLFAKKREGGGSDKYEIWCVEQLGRAKKKFKIAFLSDQPFMEQSKYLIFSIFDQFVHQIIIWQDSY